MELLRCCVMFLFGVSESGCYPTGIAQANKSMNNATMGVLLPVAGIGAIVMPYVVGAVAEQGGILAGMVCPGGNNYRDGSVFSSAEEIAGSYCIT